MKTAVSWRSWSRVLLLPAFAVLHGCGTRDSTAHASQPAPTVAEAPEESRDVVQLKLGSPRSQYLLGEPIDLHIELTNVSEQTFRRYDRGDEYLDQLFRVVYAHDDNTFRRYLSGVGEQASWELPVETYHPGETKHYQIEVLYQREGAGHLALTQPGLYRFKVGFPLPGRKAPLDIGKQLGISLAESNTIEVKVVEPAGGDAKVFELLRQPEYLYLLQTGWAGDPEDQRVRELVELLRNNPTTGYAAAIRQALAMYYESSQSYKDLKQREHLRQVLGIEPNEFFPEDRRLDQQIELTLIEKTSIPDLVRKFSDLSDVPLKASSEFDRRSTQGTIAATPLRTLMKYLNGAGARWIREGDGYRLVQSIFPEDRRFLSRRLVYAPEPTPLAAVLQKMSKLNPVSFEASPDLQEHKVEMTVETDERTIMRRLSEDLNATWVRRGEGYYLTREPEKFERNG